MAKLTSLQQEFIKALFGPAMGNLKAAAKACGLDDYSDLMTDELSEEIKKRADKELVMNVARATYVINQMLNEAEGGVFFSEKLHKVATDILDRAGISKQERPHHAGVTVGLVFLPNKNILPEPPEPIKIENSVAVP